MARSKSELTPVTPYCSIERTLVVLSDRWSFLILREALFAGEVRFADLRTSLGIASNILTDRLAGLVDAGVLERREYRDPGERARFSYHPTPAGIDLKVVLGALQQWGDVHEPRAGGPTVERRQRGSGSAASVSFVDVEGRALTPDEVEFRATDEYPGITRS